MSSRDHDYTLKIAQETLERIEALGLPADPAAFELWYTYVTGVNEPLNRCINTIIEEKGSLSIDQLERIQEDFASPSRLYSTAGQATTKISAEIDQIVGMLSELILSTARGREDCAKASSKLETAEDRDAVRAISDTLIEFAAHHRAPTCRSRTAAHRIASGGRSCKSCARQGHGSGEYGFGHGSCQSARL